MEEEFQKRFTDCVYFLASPLTCKKGMECEFRHSDIARLNPRDCWYWMSGSCLNPNCAFRHPPLDIRPEMPSESGHTNQQSTVSVNKTNVPCYFYFNGFCNKGEKCLFLHGQEDNIPTWTSSKVASGGIDGPAVEKKASVGSEIGSIPEETRPKSVEIAIKRALETKIRTEVDIQQPSPKTVVEPCASPHISGSPYDEAVDVRSNSAVPAEGFMHERSSASSGESSDDQMEDHVERDEWLESSPGFDVLVDDRLEELGYEDDPEYLLQRDGEGSDFKDRYYNYNFEDNLEYDPSYPDIGLSHGEERHDCYDHSEHGRDYLNGIPGPRRDRCIDYLPRRRKFLPPNMASNGHYSVDLRDYLTKRRLPDDHYDNHFSRRHELALMEAESRERSQQYGTGQRQGRLASKVESNVGLLLENETLRNNDHLRGRPRHFRVNSSRHHFKRQRTDKLVPPIVSRRSTTRRRTNGEDNTRFSGPRSLSRAGEDRRRGRHNGDFSGRNGSSRNEEDFQGPKPLSEILKEKRRLGSVIDTDH